MPSAICRKAAAHAYAICRMPYAYAICRMPYAVCHKAAAAAREIKINHIQLQKVIILLASLASTDLYRGSLNVRSKSRLA
jgi:hypothetical protein